LAAFLVAQILQLAKQTVFLAMQSKLFEKALPDQIFFLAAKIGPPMKQRPKLVACHAQALHLLPYNIIRPCS
jgi:hypothetical protein